MGWCSTAELHQLGGISSLIATLKKKLFWVSWPSGKPGVMLESRLVWLSEPWSGGEILRFSPGFVSNPLHDHRVLSASSSAKSGGWGSLGSWKKEVMLKILDFM